MDPRCSVKRGLALTQLSLVAALALTTLVTMSPTLVEARGRTKAEVAPTSQHQSRTSIRPKASVARPVALTRRPTQIATAISPISGPAAIRAANAEALAPSRADGFANAAQVFPYETGRVFEIWTAPLRITTISLEPGETITNKAAGDTERWMIGDTSSGAGATLQTHILVKPFKAGIATNMVVTTNRRVYFLSLRAAEQADAFNSAVTWTHPQPLPNSGVQTVGNSSQLPTAATTRTAAIDTLNQNYRIRAGWRKPPWTQVSVSDDGRQTFITFPESLASTAPPPMLVIGEAGKS